jgi:hypothetical protein
VTLKIGVTLKTIGLVQSAHGGSSGLGFSSNVTAGDLLCATAGELFHRGQYCTDTLGTVFYKLRADMLLDLTHTDLNFPQVSCGFAPATGADTVTCASVVSSISEFSNVMYAANDNTLLTQGSTASPATVTSGTFTPLVPNELLYAVGSAYSSASSMTAQSPLADIGPNAAGDVGYDILSTVTGYTFSFAMTDNAAALWEIQLLGFRPSASAASPSAIHHRVQVIQSQ